MIDAPQRTREIEETTQGTCSLLVFRLAGQAFALTIESVVQIIPMLRLTLVPQVDHMIEGVANIHGAVVPVISVRRYLGLPVLMLELYTPIILVKVGERQVGLIVDEVTDVISVPVDTIVAPGDILPQGVENYPVMSGLVYQQGHSVLMLDPRYLLRPSQFRTIHRSINANTHPVMVSAPQEPGKPSRLQQPITPDRVTFEMVRAALERKHNEIYAPDPNAEPESLPETPVEKTKPVKRGIRKAKIIPNTAGNPRVQNKKIHRNINSVLAMQFAELARDVSETDENTSSKFDDGTERSGDESLR